jgi:hypothetical protein
MKTRIRRIFRVLIVTIPLSLAVGAPSGCGSNTSGVCCKTCTTGKACGDSCISRDKTCQVGAGCACNG